MVGSSPKLAVCACKLVHRNTQKKTLSREIRRVKGVIMGIAVGFADAPRKGICGLVIVGCDGCGLLKVEAFLPKLVNDAKLFFGQGWSFGGSGVFAEFVEGGEIGEDGGNGGPGEAERDGGLGEGTAGVFGEKTDGPGLGQSPVEPFLLRVGAMVGGIKVGRPGVVAVGEDLGGVGGAGD